MRFECYFCHVKTVEKLIEKFRPDAAIAEDFIFSIHDLLSKSRDMSNPYLATYIHRLAKEKLNHHNLYSEEKSHANQLLLQQYYVWKNIIERSRNPLYMATKLAVVGNIIDYGAHSVDEDISKQVNSLLLKNLLIDRRSQLVKQIGKAKSILYIGDNAGEIVFDKLFIETMQHPNVLFIVRGHPVLNDVTIDDARQTGLNKICRILTNGSDAPSTLLDMCSDEFKGEFNDADLIIAKGQGNFEGLMNIKRKNIFFLLIAKCNPIAELLGIPKGGMVITDLNKSINGI